MTLPYLTSVILYRYLIHVLYPCPSRSSSRGKCSRRSWSCSGIHLQCPTIKRHQREGQAFTRLSQSCGTTYTTISNSWNFMHRSHIQWFTIIKQFCEKFTCSGVTCWQSTKIWFTSFSLDFLTLNISFPKTLYSKNYFKVMTEDDQAVD